MSEQMNSPENISEGEVIEVLNGKGGRTSRGYGTPCKIY